MKTDPAELEKRTLELMMHFDALDFDAVKQMTTVDVQGVDELSKTWLRGTAGMDEYFRTVGGQLAEVRSTISDVAVKMHGEVGIVTCMVDQTYKYGGKTAAIKAPTTIVYTKDDSDWKICLIHAVGIPDVA